MCLHLSVCPQGAMMSVLVMDSPPPPTTRQQADGTHPTAMLFSFSHLNINQHQFKENMFDILAWFSPTISNVLREPKKTSNPTAWFMSFEKQDISNAYSFNCPHKAIIEWFKNWKLSIYSLAPPPPPEIWHIYQHFQWQINTRLFVALSAKIFLYSLNLYITLVNMGLLKNLGTKSIILEKAIHKMFI